MKYLLKKYTLGVSLCLGNSAVNKRSKNTRESQTHGEAQRTIVTDRFAALKWAQMPRLLVNPLNSDYLEIYDQTTATYN
jgi:hypothetical protein